MIIIIFYSFCSLYFFFTILLLLFVIIIRRPLSASTFNRVPPFVYVLPPDVTWPVFPSGLFTVSLSQWTKQKRDYL